MEGTNVARLRVVGNEPEYQSGFYWVRWYKSSDWEPARFDGEHWTLIGVEIPWTPHVIGERLQAPEA
jgi:hypothetical protein